MALSQEKKDQIMQQMQQQKSSTTNIDKDINENKQETEDLEALKKQIKKLEQDNQKLNKENTSLRQEKKDKYNQDTYRQNQEAMNSILRDDDGRYFVKEYEYDKNTDNPYKFKVKMHYPNVMELSAIEQEFVDLTSARGEAFTDQVATVMRAVAYFRIVADEIPEEFKEPERVYRYDILVDVYLDYLKWADTFRKKQRI